MIEKDKSERNDNLSIEHEGLKIEQPIDRSIHSSGDMTFERWIRLNQWYSKSTETEITVLIKDQTHKNLEDIRTLSHFNVEWPKCEASGAVDRTPERSSIARARA